MYCNERFGFEILAEALSALADLPFIFLPNDHNKRICMTMSHHQYFYVLQIFFCGVES